MGDAGHPLKIIAARHGYGRMSGTRNTDLNLSAGSAVLVGIGQPRLTAG